jgi:hypothetical protein
MARGGKREGAGRKPGSPNKATQEQREAVAASGLTPLEYMLQVMRDLSQEDQKRLDAAKAAAPYVHARLNAVELNANVALSHEQWLEQLG